MSHISLRSFSLLGVLGLGLLASCDQQNDASVDQSALDRGAYRNPPVPASSTTPMTLPNDTQIAAPPEVAALANYLASTEPSGRTFELHSVRFAEGGEVRADPDGSLSAISALAAAYPSARLRVEVVQRSPGSDDPNPVALERAAAVKSALVTAGVPESQIEAVGMKDSDADVPHVRLTVTEK